MAVVRHPGGMGYWPDRMAAVRHPGGIGYWPGRTAAVRHPGGNRISSGYNGGCEASRWNGILSG